MRLRCVGTSLWHWGKYSAVLFALTLTLMAFLHATPGIAQTGGAANDWLKPAPWFPMAASDLTIDRHAKIGKDRKSVV